MSNPEIGSHVDVRGVTTNYLNAGTGTPLVLIHSLGPGVTAHANWRLVVQRWVDALATSDADISAIACPTLLVHGRDDRVIPLPTSLRLLELLSDAQLHVFGRCGHWTQIEHTKPFVRLVSDFCSTEPVAVAEPS